MAPQANGRTLTLQVLMIGLTIILGALVNNISETQARLSGDIQVLKTGQATMLTRMDAYVEAQKSVAESVQAHHQSEGHPAIVERVRNLERRMDARERRQ